MVSTKLIILIHSSKTMRVQPTDGVYRSPLLIDNAKKLGQYVQGLSLKKIESSMHISPVLAGKTQVLMNGWSDTPTVWTPAFDSFIGDVYSGLRASELSQADRDYADRTIWILSGLYGFLRPYDSICPYRLEMGYAFPESTFRTMYQFWGDTIARSLPQDGYIINVSSTEYTKVILPYVETLRVITPQFLSISPKTGVPIFTAVHAKIARGAFARWLITSRITDPRRFHEFNDLGYVYDKELSTAQSPVFVCQIFGGIGLSLRLKKDSFTV